MLDNLQKSTYVVKIPHKTGSPTKRKLEQEVEVANAKIRKLTDGLDKTTTHLARCTEDMHESQRKVDRLSAPNKNQNRQEGEQRVKLYIVGVKLGAIECRRSM